MRYKLTIAYDGSEFHGWQAQRLPDGEPLRTVQDVVTDAIQRTLGQPVVVQGASRTDTGVHALGQVAHFDAVTGIPIERLALAINSRLPRDVEIRRAEVAGDDFHAIRDAVSKQYRYRLWTSTHRPLHMRKLVYHCWTPLDVAAMGDAAGRLVGEHDFAAFAAAGHGRKSTVRTIHDCHVEQPDTMDPLLCDQVHIVVSGNGFLYNMVRIIAGTLVEVGRGRWGAEHVDRLLAEPNRRDAGPTLPPEGLCLEWIQHRESAGAEPPRAEAEGACERGLTDA